VRTSRIRTAGWGALLGALLALAATALLGGRYALPTATATPVSEGSAAADLAFTASTGWTYLLVIVAGVVCGAGVAAAVYAFGRESEPDAPRFPLRWLIPAAAAVFALFGYAVIRATILLFGDTVDGIVTVPLTAMILGGLIGGTVAGTVTAGVVDRLARPEALGLGGEAWPASPAALAREASRAIGTSIVALVLVAGFAVALAELLLAVEGTAAIVVFAVAGAVVLGGATLLAYRPWERSSEETA
jgi:hypothetical protein